MEKRRPIVAEIKRNSLDDGPGIRSVVFFKGCPLRCVWCHNPEATRAGPEVIYRADACMSCGTCAETCPEDAIGEAGAASLNRKACTVCGDCVDECPTGALSVIGRYYEPEDLVDLLLRDKSFYENSGGGVTLSGGEPTLRMDYTATVARRLKENGVNVLLESCGDFDWDKFAAKLLPYVDRVYVDLKLEADSAHERFTGRGNERIKANIARLLNEPGLDVLVRVPLVPGVTATPENMEGLACWFRTQGLERIALMPYNPLWISKAQGLGRDLDYSHARWMSQEERTAAKQAFAEFTLERDF